jgi:hypothetical protein
MNPPEDEAMARVLTSLSALAAAALLGAAACGSSSPPQRLTFDVNVVGGRMTPTDKLVAHSGDTITMTVSADRAEEIHLHGYNFRFYPKPGKPQTMRFVANKEGSFEIEIEESSTHLGELDVYPR